MENYLNRYQEIRKTTESICEPLQIEDYVIQPTPDVSPPKWHLAHTTWFFETFLLKEFSKDYKEFHPKFGYLFNSYYISIGDRALRTERGYMTRPTVEEVYQYRKHVDFAVAELLSRIITDEMKNVLDIGFNHEQQHQELLFYDIKYILGHNPLFPVYDKGFEEYFTEDQAQDWLQINKGNYPIGFEGKGFSFDIEHNHHEVHLEEAQISNRLVTNGEYAEFIEVKGYENHNYWHSDAMKWLETSKIANPLYWHKIDGQWNYYTLAGLKPINESAPLMHVSYYEAHAFAEWKGLRLPTEFEWETASNLFDWGRRWEHTESAFLPYPGYKKAGGAIGEYNGKFMVNQMVMRGASRATAKNHSRKTYRNFFHPHLQWHFSGIRLAKDL